MRNFDPVRVASSWVADLPGVVRLSNDGGSAAFYRGHLWLPLAAFLLLSGLLMGAGVDQVIADRFYAWQGHVWALRSGFYTETLGHVWGKHLSQLLWGLVLFGFVTSMRRPALTQWRLPLFYLLLCTLLATALVGLMKRWTHMDCPWDLLRYGGEKAYYGLFSTRPSDVVPGGCFPAGHASAGYAWVASYFFLRQTRPHWRWWGLATGIALGAVFGLAQQLRGAHFLSHDLWSLMICWLVALALYRAFWPGPMGVGADGADA